LEDDSRYSKVFEIPPFEPSDADIGLNDCINADKYAALVKDIDADLKSGALAAEEAIFLKLCASRWVQFHYERIAQWHSTKASAEMKRLLENSAAVLVGIDRLSALDRVVGKNRIDTLLGRDAETQIDEFFGGE